MAAAKEERIFILPGEAHFATEKTRITTVLGSCVSVCLYDAVKQFGGLNHYMLAEQGDGTWNRGKYGDCAIRDLIAEAKKAGCKKTDLKAQIYGGGNVVGHLGSAKDDVGEKNIDIALQLLGQFGISLVRREVGDFHGRKIHMDTSTGIVEVKEVQRLQSNTRAAEKLQIFKKRKIRVLIVDDSAIVRKILRRGIETSDEFEIIGEAEDPYEAREKILETDPDVICLDIIMPKMDGYEFLKKIMRYKPIPTVIVSTIAKEGSVMRRNVEEAGAVGVIDKDELQVYKGLDVLRKVLLPTLSRAARTVVQKAA